jgi:hypothetical protein
MYTDVTVENGTVTYVRTMAHDSEKRDDLVKVGRLATVCLDTHYTKPGSIDFSFIPLVGGEI